jgi:hypothetical protein
MIDSTPLTDAQASQLRSLLNRRLTAEIIEQRDGCTIEGVAYAQDGHKRLLDVGKVGVLYKDVIWSVPNMCRHCKKYFNDGKFVLDGIRITYEAHAGLPTL